MSFGCWEWGPDPDYPYLGWWSIDDPDPEEEPCEEDED